MISYIYKYIFITIYFLFLKFYLYIHLQNKNFKAGQKVCLKLYIASKNIFWAPTGVWTDSGAENTARDKTKFLHSWCLYWMEGGMETGGEQGGLHTHTHRKDNSLH